MSLHNSFINGNDERRNDEIQIYSNARSHIQVHTAQDYTHRQRKGDGRCLNVKRFAGYMQIDGFGSQF